MPGASVASVSLRCALTYRSRFLVPNFLEPVVALSCDELHEQEMFATRTGMPGI
jgi:hypothetical protein